MRPFDDSNSYTHSAGRLRSRHRQESCVARAADPVAEMRRVLLASGTRIVDGPTAADAYISSVAPERAEQAAAIACVGESFRAAGAVADLVVRGQGRALKDISLGCFSLLLLNAAGMVCQCMRAERAAVKESPDDNARQILVMLHLPVPHYRPGATYGRQL